MLHESLGALCYLCDFVPTTIVHSNTGTIGSSNSSSASSIDRRSTAMANASFFLQSPTIYTIVPRDAYKQRLFLEPLGE